MPYIICVNRPGYLPEQDPYAVATIEEARDVAYAEVIVCVNDTVHESAPGDGT